jgi:hypothetical protein
MACPSGCINGGAQPRPPPGADPREYAAGVAAALAAASVPDDADAALQRVYSLLGAEGVGSPAARQVRRPPARARANARRRLTRSSTSTRGSRTCTRRVWWSGAGTAW